MSGAAIRFDGQVSVFDPRDPASPCYHCLFGEGEELEETRCATMGVFAPLVGIVGTTQAAEALKLIAGIGETITGRLLLLDAFAMRWREVHIARDPACPVCGEHGVRSIKNGVGNGARRGAQKWVRNGSGPIKNGVRSI